MSINYYYSVYPKYSNPRCPLQFHLKRFDVTKLVCGCALNLERRVSLLFSFEPYSSVHNSWPIHFFLFLVFLPVCVCVPVPYSLNVCTSLLSRFLPKKRLLIMSPSCTGTLVRRQNCPSLTLTSYPSLYVCASVCVCMCVNTRSWFD